MAQPPIIVDTTTNARAVYQIDPLTGLPLVVSGGGGGAVTIADGADVNQGSTADAAVAAGAAGTISAKFRRLTTDIGTLVTSMAATGTGSQNFQGGDANGAATTVKPVLIAGTDGTNTRSIGAAIHDAVFPTTALIASGGYASTATPTAVSADGDIVRPWLTRNGATVATLVNAAGTAQGTIANLGAGDGNSSGGGLYTYSFGMLLNAAGTFDRMRGDANGTVVQSSLSAASWRYAGATGGITDAADNVLIAAGGAAVRNYCTGIQYANTSAVASEIVIKDGATVIWRGYANATVASEQPIRFDPPLRGSLNTAMNVAMITTGTATRVSAQGFQGV